MDVWKRGEKPPLPRSRKGNESPFFAVRRKKATGEHGFRAGSEDFFVVARKSRNCAEAYTKYVAQAITQIDAARAKKDRFQPKTAWEGGQVGCPEPEYLSI
jgi:hypothetical protein